MRQRHNRMDSELIDLIVRQSMIAATALAGPSPATRNKIARIPLASISRYSVHSTSDLDGPAAFGLAIPEPPWLLGRHRSEIG
jgi:hypothetical protein